MSRKMRGQMTTLEVGSYNKMVQMPTPRPKWVKKTNLHGEWLYPNSKKGFERTVCSWIMDGGWRGSQAVTRPRPDTTDTSQYLLCILTLCPGDQLSSAQFVWSQPGVVLVTLKHNNYTKLHGRSCLWLRWNHKNLFKIPSHCNFASTQEANSFFWKYIRKIRF